MWPDDVIVGNADGCIVIQAFESDGSGRDWAGACPPHPAARCAPGPDHIARTFCRNCSTRTSKSAACCETTCDSLRTLLELRPVSFAA